MDYGMEIINKKTNKRCDYVSLDNILDTNLLESSYDEIKNFLSEFFRNSFSFSNPPPLKKKNYFKKFFKFFRLYILFSETLQLFRILFFFQTRFSFLADVQSE